MNKININDIVNDNFNIFQINLIKKSIGKLTINQWINRMKQVLYERSWDEKNMVLHDVIKGIVDKRLYWDNCDKNIKQEILNWIERIHLDVRNKIWNERCEIIKEKEKELGIRN